MNTMQIITLVLTFIVTNLISYELGNWKGYMNGMERVRKIFTKE